MNILKVVMIALAVFTSGCVAPPTKDFANTGDLLLAPLPENCEVRVYSTQPKSGYDELGVVEIGYWNFFIGSYHLSTVSEVKEFVSADVCEAGGDAILLWEANGNGWYTKATVIKLKDA